MTAPGWYPSPDGKGTRWWDGHQWTTTTQHTDRNGPWKVAGVTAGLIVVALVLVTVIGTSLGSGGTVESRGPLEEPSMASDLPSNVPDSLPTTASPTATTESPRPATTIPPGIYAVGEDILPGRYRSDGGSLCYWATLRDTTGEFDSIIANNLSDGGAQIVEIGPGAPYFETSGCGTWRQG